VGSTWEHQRTDSTREVDVAGVVLEATPPDRLVITFGPPGEPPTTVTFDIESYGAIVRLTVTHEDLPSDGGRSTGRSRLAGGAVQPQVRCWRRGMPCPKAPWEMAQR